MHNSVVVQVLHAFQDLMHNDNGVCLVDPTALEIEPGHEIAGCDKFLKHVATRQRSAQHFRLINNGSYMVDLIQ